MTFQNTYVGLRGQLLRAPSVDVGKWHNVDVSGSPVHLFRELRDVRVERIMADTVERTRREVKPNLPWAEDHFQERVSGQPLNPPPSEAWWPFGNTARHKTNEHFSHSYPERFWPRFANEGGTCDDSERVIAVPIVGIRYEYGDLLDVVNLLKREPMTRQAVLPVWFPEDTGNVADVRLPCSLSYQWQMRDFKLHCTYTMRSVDFWRHFRDDVYMAERLTQWIIDSTDWEMVSPGTLTMNIGNLHLLEGDAEKARNEALNEAF